jgi:hypothetical protein
MILSFSITKISLVKLLPGGQNAEANWLERPFQEEEVLQALLSMDGDKVSGPDGFTIFFLVLLGYREG